MTDSERDRLVRIEAVLPAIQNSMTKIMESQESITLLKLSAEEQREFVKNFEKEVIKIVKTELKSSDFHDEIDKQIDKRVDIIFNTKEVRNSFKESVTDIIDEKITKSNSALFRKMISFIGVAIGALILALIKGVFGA